MSQLTQKKAEAILKACNKVYNKGKGGNIQDAIKEADKRGVKDTIDCKGCETTQPAVKYTATIKGNPSIVKVCVICGQSTHQEI